MQDQLQLLGGLALAGALFVTVLFRSKRLSGNQAPDGKASGLNDSLPEKALIAINAGLDSAPDRLDRNASDLVKIDLQGNHLQTFPDTVCSCSHLRALNLNSNQLEGLPAGIGQLQQLEDLSLAHNRITSLPDSIGQLKSLKLFNIMGNQLTSLPDSIGNLHLLYRLGLKSNKLQSLPETFGGLTGLVELFATDNLLQQLPASMGQLKSLVKLQLSFNQLRSLPPEMGTLPNLELMRIAVNEVKEVPETFARLHKLAWFSLAGNPACAPAHPARPDIKTLMPHDVPPQEILGSGASGEVHASTYERQAVAVKRFVSDVSPDGHARDEIAVTCCIDHPNLIKVIGMIVEPPCLVVGRVDGQQMAAKPNLQSLLRCRWAAGTEFQLRFLLRVALSIASALAYLHSLGICHGDVYAHNILPDPAGNAVLCDYGASFFYHKGPVPWEAQEVRAYGLFINDMIHRLASHEHEHETTAQQLRRLIDRCMNEPTHSRPLFSEVVEALKTMDLSQ